MKLRRHIVTLTLLALVLGGCAVVRIEVDAYRGPLSDDPRLQLAMAEALCEELERAYEEARDAKQITGGVNEGAISPNNLPPETPWPAGSIEADALVGSQTGVPKTSPPVASFNLAMSRAGDDLFEDVRQLAVRAGRIVQGIRSNGLEDHMENADLLLARVDALLQITRFDRRLRELKCAAETSLRAHFGELKEDWNAASSAEDLREVLDQLIVDLEFRRIAVHSGDKKNANVQSLDKALAEAEEFRASLVHIMPALSYLKAQSTEAGDSESWFNDLDKQWARAIAARQPDYPSSQYWERVNEIRVAGGGNVNYVIAKDDVGNWYVKQYSTNKSDIYRSAVALTLAASGTAVSPETLQQVLAFGTGEEVALSQSESYLRAVHDAASERAAAEARRNARRDLASFAARVVLQEMAATPSQGKIDLTVAVQNIKWSDSDSLHSIVNRYRSMLVDRSEVDSSTEAVARFNATMLPLMQLKRDELEELRKHLGRSNTN